VAADPAVGAVRRFPATRAVEADSAAQADPPHPVDPADQPHQPDPAHQADRPAQPDPTHQAARAGPPHQPHLADPADLTTTGQACQANPTVTTGDLRGTQAITTGVVDFKAPHGVKVCRHGAGARHRGRRGTDRCPRRGDRLPRKSTTAASMSSRCGTRATSNGASGSSGSGFLSRADLRQDGRLACAGRSSARSIHLGE